MIVEVTITVAVKWLEGVITSKLTMDLHVGLGLGRILYLDQNTFLAKTFRLIQVIMESMRRSVQVVAVSRGVDKIPVFRLIDEDALKKVLLQDHVKDLPVVILSIAGKYREGKSFFMNLVEGFLRNKGAENWLSPENISSDCFQWEAGAKGCTSGIWIAGETFVVEGPDGEKIAVLLMDTQGTFDTTSSMKECSTIFALSTLLSNIQICNLKDKFSRDDLEALQMFLEFAKTAQGQGQGNKPFKALKFLIRDWSDNEEYPLGAVGGDKFVQDQNHSNNILGDVSEEFERVDSFLLPVPWNNYQSRSKRVEAITDLSDKFKTHLTHLVTSTLSWDNLQMLVKTDLGGNIITTKDIISYIEAYVKIFARGDVLAPMSAYEANMEISLVKATERALQLFDTVIARELGNQSDDSPSVPVASLNTLLSSARSQTVKYFESSVEAITNKTKIAGYLSKLLEEINGRSWLWTNKNSWKIIKEDREKYKEEAERIKKETDKKLEDIELRREQGERDLVSLSLEMSRQKYENEEYIRELESSRKALESRLKENEESVKARDERERIKQEENIREKEEKAKRKREKKKERDDIKARNNELQKASTVTSMIGHIGGGALALASYIPIPEIAVVAKAVRVVGLVVLPPASTAVSKIIEAFKKPT